MSTVGWLPAPAEELFGPEATAQESYEVLTVDVPPTAWTPALRVARDQLGCTYFDWLSAVDEPGEGFRVAAHVVALSPVRRLLLRTTVPHEAPALSSAVEVYAGAAWHERETHEMFGVGFEGHPGLDHLLLPETFEGHPLRKDFVLASRVVKAWPGAKEPGESEHGGPKRRQMLPPGVPDPNEWGPLKGLLPPAPARPARGVGRAAGERPVRGAGAGERPVRRARTSSEGVPPETPPAPPAPPAPPRRSRSVSQGSASQRTPATEAEAEDAEKSAPSESPATPRSADAPWHHARPAFDEPEPKGTEPAPANEPAEEPSADATQETPGETPAETPTPEDPAGGPR